MEEFLAGEDFAAEVEFVLHAGVAEVPECVAFVLEIVGEEVQLEFAGMVVGIPGAVEEPGYAGVDGSDAVADFPGDQLAGLGKQGWGENFEIRVEALLLECCDEGGILVDDPAFFSMACADAPNDCKEVVVGL